MSANAVHAAAALRRTGFNHPAAWWVCAGFGLLGCALHYLPWPASGTLRPAAQQLQLWLCAALLLALWSIPQLSKFAAVLLVFLAISVLGIAPSAPILEQAASDALLVALSALAMSAAAQSSGVIGWLLSTSYRLSRHKHRLASSMALTLVFACLPSPRQAHAWRHIWQLIPIQRSTAYCHMGLACQLSARLMCIAAHPANMLLLALLPHSGTDRFLPWHWAGHMWPLAVASGCMAIWSARQGCNPDMAGASTTPSTCTASNLPPHAHVFGLVATTVCAAVLLQPWHGLSTGLLMLLALVALFALHTLSAQQFHHGVDWSLWVTLIVLPGLLLCFAAAMPTLGVAWDVTQRPWLVLPVTLFLRFLLPSASVAIVVLLFALTCAAQHGADLLHLAIPLVAAAHISDYLVLRTSAARPARAGARARAMLLDPAMWASLVVFDLWCTWHGW